MVLKHHKPKGGEQGRLDTFPGNIHVSNVQHCVDNKIIRVGFKFIDGKKMLISKSTGKEIRKV
jgi:ribosomal protein L24